MRWRFCQAGAQGGRSGVRRTSASGGVKGGVQLVKTDEFGFNATLLQLIGFDHNKLACRAHGRDFRLTDVNGNVVNEVLA